MSLVQRDYIQRLIEAMGAAIARALRRRLEGDHTGARREVQMACSELLGAMAPLAERLDARTAADLVGDPRRVAMWGRLLAVDADLLQDMGRTTEAAATARRALELLLESTLRDPTANGETRALVDALRTRVPASALDPRHRERLSRADGDDGPA
jgi:hypothetical protein